MKIKDLYKRDLNLVPFASYIDQEVLFEEYQKAPLIPDLYLFLQNMFPGQIIDENIPREKIETARAEFFKEITQGTIPEYCKKPDISQTETFKSLEKLSNSYDKFLKNVATSQNPKQRTELITYQLSELSLKNQLSIIDHILTDDTVPTAIKTGKIRLNRTNLIPLDIVEQRLEDFKNSIVEYKNTLSVQESKVSRSKKPEKKFDEYLSGIGPERLSILKAYLLKLWHGKENQKNIAYAIHILIDNGNLSENLIIAPFVRSIEPEAKNFNNVQGFLSKKENFSLIDKMLADENPDIGDKIKYEKIRANVLDVLTRAHICQGNKHPLNLHL